MPFCKSNFFFFFLMTALISACAPPGKMSDADAAKTLESSVAEATSAQKAGQTDQALTLLKGAANRFPADKTPWQRIAQIKFDNGNYGEAITNALEALQRDPADKIANSIVTVSGLRLATKSLSNLRTQNALSGTVKSEAQDLAKMLRETLGEPVLVPPPSKPSAARVAPRVNLPGATKPTGSATKADSNNDSGHPNPFGGLK